MGDVVHLNHYRKQKAKEQAKKQAHENRVKHGLPGHVHKRNRSEQVIESKRLEQYRRELLSPPKNPTAADREET